MTLGQVVADSGGRRFCMTIGAGLFSTALLVGGYIQEGAYVTLQLGTVGAYIAGNVIQKYGAAKFSASVDLGSDDDIIR